MTNSEGNQATENESAQQIPAVDPRPGESSSPNGNGRCPPEPSGPPDRIEEYRECLEEVAAIVAGGTDPTVRLAQLAMVLSEAEDRGLIAPDRSGDQGSVLE
ncbi:hypothetical protein GGP50_003373 [Salinibacter ruber]|nr:hypothetical protein [Salinibacter ruber]